MDLEGNDAIIKAKEKLAAALREVAAAKKFINDFYALYNQPAPYQEADEEPEIRTHIPAGRSVRKDEYYGHKLGTALVSVLERLRTLGKAPADLDDIYGCLEDGGFHFSTNVERDRRSGISVALSKGDEFIRLPQGGWGLRKWYPSTPQARKPKKGGITEAPAASTMTKEKVGGEA